MATELKYCGLSDVVPNDVAALARGDLTALIVEDFVSPSARLAAVSVIDPQLFGTYDRTRYFLPARRFGPTLNEHRAGATISDTYWEYLTQADGVWRRIAELNGLRGYCREALSGILETCVAPASARGRSLYWGILREINEGTLIHWDDVTKEYPLGMLDSAPIAQMAFNLFLKVPPVGGQTRIWTKRRTEADEVFRRGFGYDPGAVGDASPVEVSPQAGAALFFDSRKYHSVTPSEGGSRLTFSFFLGLGSDDEVMIWS